MSTAIPYERYERQILLKELGELGQQKLLAAKVLVVGAGGLGCPILQYLVAAGVGTIGIIDDDIVALHNLHRQVLYTFHDIGKSKVERAAYYLAQLNPDIKIIVHQKRLWNDNALAIIEDFDIILDGTDNFATRYMVNDACMILGKPLVYGAIARFEGQVAIFNCKKGKEEIPTNYRDLFPTAPKVWEVQNCAEAGVMGVLPGIIGMMMASEAIKLITGIGETLIDRLLIYNLLNNQSYQIGITHNNDSDASIPKDKEAFMKMDYEWFCGNITSTEVVEIDQSAFQDSIFDDEVDIVDVRELHEYPQVTEFEHLHMPLSVLEKRYTEIEKGRVVLFCQSGMRSLQAAHLLAKIFGTQKKIVSLKGGIVSWKNKQASQS
jgi:sulfur-carrier protein adenylyltransferase/sulfurtransferase